MGFAFAYLDRKQKDSKALDILKLSRYILNFL
jgi:hypothetical protein